MGASRTVLMVAFQFPPFAGSSAVQRTLRFARYLPRFGWKPVILTAHPIAYETATATVGNEVPEGLEVHRAFGLDAARHLSLFGRYPRALAVPDRWALWRHFALRAARRVIQQQPVTAIWSTFPIATAHRIGRDIAAWAGVPWVAEFRDPMWQGDYPPDPKVNASWKKLEGEIFADASRVVVTTRGARQMYLERFPGVPADRVSIISNGFDEDVFQRAEAALQGGDSSRRRPFTLLHSGVIYPSERDPTQLFAAIASLKRENRITAQGLQIVLRASGNDAWIRKALEAEGIADIVRLEPPTGYLAALNEMLSADALLILQAANCNAQIPAKLYEYVRCGKPILALTDPKGDTAAALEDMGAGLIAPLDSPAEITTALLRLIGNTGDLKKADAATVAHFSRERLTQQLASLLDDLSARTRSSI